jgi:hypothetical protein
MPLVRAAFGVAMLLMLATGPALAADDGAGSAPAAPPPAAPAAAAAGDAAAPDATMREFPSLKRPSLVHAAQIGIALLPGTGYRGIFPYKSDELCEKPDGNVVHRVCTGRLPFFLDAQLSFGFAQHWDAIVDLRFGIEQDFTQTHQFAVAPGFRYWVDPELHTKFFATIQMAIDTTDQQQPGVQNNDFAVRNENGFMYDVMRNIGVYLQFGETIGFRRWLRFEIDGGLGVQARFP